MEELPNARIYQLPELSESSSSDLLVIYHKSSGITKFIKAENILPSTNDGNFEWKSTIDFSTDDVCTRNGKWWQSLVDNNKGNIPTEGAFWTQINKPTVSSLTPWEAGVYTRHYSQVVDGTSLYYLKPSVTLPFDSQVAPSSDLTNWQLVSGGGGGGGVSAQDIQNNIHAYDEDSGTANAYSVVPVPPFTAHVDGMRFYFKAINGNTGASTLDDGLDERPIVRRDGTPLKANDIPSGSMNEVVRDGNQWQLMSSNFSDDEIPFVFSVEVVDSETISLPMQSGSDSDYDFSVNFGDGTPTQNVGSYGSPNREHTYLLAGIYDITIRGLFNYIRFADSPLSIIEIKSWGKSKIGISSFIGCSNLDVISASDVPKVRSNSLLNCFNGCPLTTVSESINNLDVSAVTSLSEMFEDSSFNQDISGWDVSSVTDFGGMFRDNTVFNQDIGGWDVSSGSLFDTVFFGATSFNQDIGGWNMSNATKINSMFRGAIAFNQDIGSWVTDSVNDLNFIFSGATAFNQDISSWNVGGCSNFSDSFRDAVSFDQDISGWNMSNATNLSNMFRDATAFNQDISGWDVESVTALNNTLSGCGMNVTNYDALLIGWAAQNVVSGLTFNVVGLEFTLGGAAEAARTSLISVKTWTIIGDTGI